MALERDRIENMKRLGCFAIVCAIGISNVHGADLPPPVLPAGVGVNIHFVTGHEKDLDLIAEAGFKFIRMDFSWGGTERKKGEYDWKGYDELTANLEKRGLRAIYILDYSNGIYEDTITSKNPVTGQEHRDTASPQKPESVAAFARWAAAAAEHYKGRRVIWEIWNEPNIGFWKPKPDAKQYTALALATCKAIRQIDPQATIIAPASSGFPWAFFEELFRSGALEFLDAVSVHPYRSYKQGPETAAADYRRLRQLIYKYAPAGKKDMPIISGEWGYATHTKGGVSLETQAAFIARQQLANLYHGVPLSIWYDWKNDGPDPAYNEHNFGTVQTDLTPKPAYVSVKTLTRELSGYRIVRRLPMASEEDWALLCKNQSGQLKLSVWTTGGEHQATINVGADALDDFSAVNSKGEIVPVKVRNGELVLSLQPAPQYITIKTPTRAIKAWGAIQMPAGVGQIATAGLANDVKFPFKIENPYEVPVEVSVQAQWTGKSASSRDAMPLQRKILNPRQAWEQEARLTLTQRYPDTAHTRFAVTFKEAGRGAQASPLAQCEDLQTVIVANPMILSVAPTETGMRLQIQNPSLSPFKGRVQAGRASMPVNLGARDAEANLELPHLQEEQRLIQILDDKGGLVAELNIPKFRQLRANNFRAALDGDAKVPAQASVTLVAPPAGRDAPASRVFKLDYQFAAGWRFVRCAPSLTDKLEGQPAALGLWVYGDKSGNVLRMRVRDESGQTFQPNGPAIDWSGWRWVTFDLADLRHAGHWGGANDGIRRGILEMDCPLLLDGQRNATEGSIYFTAPALIYQ